MMRRTTVVLLLLAASISAQEAVPALRITSPAADSLVSGTVTLSATVEPASVAKDVTQVTFYVDGRSACVDTTPEALGCTWDAGADVQAHVVRAVAEMRGRPRLVATIHTRALDYVEKVSVNAIQVNAVVLDGGKFVRGLTRDAFRIREDGVPQRISHFAPEGSPLELVLAVDVSGSMSQSVPELKTAVKKFLAGISSRDHVTMLAFNDTWYALARREADPAARAKAVDRLSAWGGTSLYDVIVKSFDQVSREPGRHAVVVFTDGEDRSSLTTLESVETRIRKSDATLYAVSLGRGPKIAALKAVLERLTAATGGRTIFAEHADKLEGPFGEIFQELSNQYLLGYEPTNRKHDGTWRRIDVETVNKRHRVRARLGYTAESK
jgi:VWFA-related protein